MEHENKIIFTMITGFLGSGKTTILSHWLEHNLFKNTAVIVNEFGTVGLDHRILKRIEEKTTLLSGGCVCCNIREDLVRELSALLNAKECGETMIDRVIIETTGLADPAPILFSILTHPVLQHHFRIDSVITMVDAVNGCLHLCRNPESVKQLSVADVVIVTKTDIATQEEISQLHTQIQSINPAAMVLEAANGMLAPEAVFRSSVLPKIRQEEKIADFTRPDKQGDHVTDICTISIRFYQSLDWMAFGLWLSMLLYSHGEQVFRVKGIVDVGEAGPVLLNGVQHIIHPPQHLKSWEQETKCSEIVFIMKEITPQEIMHSLYAFQEVIGATPEIEEIYLQPYR